MRTPVSASCTLTPAPIIICRSTRCSRARVGLLLQELDEAQRASRLTKLPGLHSFLGYALFFPSVLVGPSFDFQLYHSLVNGKLFVDAEEEQQQPTAAALTAGTPSAGSSSAVDDTPRVPLVKRTSSFRKEDVQNSPEVLRRGIPKGRKRVAYVHGAVGVAFLGLYALLGSKASYGGVLTDEWKGYSLAFKSVLSFPVTGTRGRGAVSADPAACHQAPLRPGLRVCCAHQVLRRLGAYRGTCGKA